MIHEPTVILKPGMVQIDQTARVAAVGKTIITNVSQLYQWR